MAERLGPVLVDALTWQEVAAAGLDEPTRVRVLTYLPDGKTLAFGSDDHRVRLWHLNPRRHSPALKGHSPKEAWDVAFSPDGTTLATSGDDGLVRFWDPATGREARTKLKGARVAGHRDRLVARWHDPRQRRLGPHGAYLGRGVRQARQGARGT